MNRLAVLSTIIITTILVSILVPTTITLALITPSDIVALPQLSKTEVYIGPERTVKILIHDDDPIKMSIINESNNKIYVKMYVDTRKLDPSTKDEIYAFVTILVGGSPIPLAEVHNVTDNQTKVLLKNVALLRLKETDNNTMDFVATLTVEVANETKVDNVGNISKIYVSPFDVAKGIVVNITYPDLLGNELKWLSKTFEIKAKVPVIEVDKKEVVPGQNFTIILKTQSLNIKGQNPDYIAIDNETGEVYWVTSKGKIKVGVLNITVKDPEGKTVAFNLAKCTVNVNPKLTLTEKLKVYIETGANTATFEIPVNGKCIRDSVPGMTKNYKINVTYYDFYTGETVYVEIPVKEIQIILKAYMYYNNKLVKNLSSNELPIIYYTKLKDGKPIKAGFNYTLNITVYDPAYLRDFVTIEVYNVTGGLEASFNVSLFNTGKDTRWAKVDIEVNETHIIFKFEDERGANRTKTVKIDDICLFRYLRRGSVKIIYYDKELELQIALPKDDKIIVKESELDRVAGNITLEFHKGDLPLIPEDLAIEIKWVSRDGIAYSKYFTAKDLGIDAEGKAVVNITQLLATKMFNGDYIKAARAIIGAEIIFAYTDPLTYYNLGKQHTFKDTVKILAHDAKVEPSAYSIGPCQWFNITIIDPDIFYEAKSYIGENLVILFDSTSTSKKLKELLDEDIADFKQNGDKYIVYIKLWEAARKGYLNASGDKIQVYYHDDTPANKPGVYHYRGEIIVKPTEGVIVKPKDTDVVKPGDKLEIIVKDPDPDIIDPTKQDIIKVVVWSTSYPKRKSIMLFETADNSGIFKATILVTNDWSSRDDPGAIYAEPGDYIYIAYHDKYPDKIKIVVLVVKEAAPAPALMKWIYINASGIELVKDEQWWIEKDPYTGIERLIVRLPFHNATDVEFSTTYYSILYYREKPTAKYKFVDLGSDIPDMTISVGAVSVRLPVAAVSKIRDYALKYGGVEDGLYKIYATLIIVNKATGDLATKVWLPQVGDWVVWPVTLTIYVDAEGNIVKVVLGST